ncbi:hypothetical protein IWX49DRAFT_578205 [Phyllosticta citricarpa]
MLRELLAWALHLDLLLHRRSGGGSGGAKTALPLEATAKTRAKQRIHFTVPRKNSQITRRHPISWRAYGEK